MTSGQFHRDAGCMIKPDKWKWFGNAAHLCVSNRCRFHLATEVGKYLISTVGEYCPKEIGPTKEHWETLGIDKDSYYETMVFEWSGRCSCGCGLPETTGSELTTVRYHNAANATTGHLDLCNQYAKS